MLVKILKGIKNTFNPNYWADRVGEGSGAYDKARESKLATWVSNLEGWQWWTWQLGPCLLIFILIEVILNMIGMTMLPWR